MGRRWLGGRRGWRWGCEGLILNFGQIREMSVNVFVRKSHVAKMHLDVVSSRDINLFDLPKIPNKYNYVGLWEGP